MSEQERPKVPLAPRADYVVGRATDPALQAPRPGSPGLFTVHFDNKKRQIHGYQAYDAEGTRYSDGRVHVNTSDFSQRDFETLHAMQEAFAEYGECCVTWLDEKGHQ